MVDASVTAAWCFDDETTEYAREILRQSSNIRFLVPAIWPLEMANVLLTNERRNRITAADTNRAISLFRELEIQVDRRSALHQFDATLALARAHRLSSYDASHVELASRHSLPLATLDNRMRISAQAAGVQMYP